MIIALVCWAADFAVERAKLAIKVSAARVRVPFR